MTGSFRTSLTHCMSNTASIIWKSIGVGLAATLLIAAVLMGYRMRPTATTCPALEYIIEDQKERMYLTPAELDALLRAEKIYPVGRTLDIGLLHRIEKTVLQHPMVRTAECYRTPRNEVRIRITQRVPLLMVAIPNEAYFVDTDRKAMPVRASVKDQVLVVTGAVGAQMASQTMADFAIWLQDNSYWRTRIHHLHVRNPQMVYIYLRGENQPRVVLGNMKRYEQKLTKLRTFFEKGAEATKDKNYQELDLRFKGQVIGRY